jgi:putative membrane protein
VVVTSSGNLAHVYFAQVPNRLSLEQVMTTYPGLIEALVGHEGVEFVIAVSETRGPVVMAKQAVRELDAQDGLAADDLLTPFGPNTAGFLSRLARFPHSGDVMVMGKYDPSTGQVITMDELVGAHGGVGGMQTQPFVLYPSEWTDRPPTIVGADGLHRFLRRYVLDEPQGDHLAEATSASAGRQNGSDRPSVGVDAAAGHP